MEAPGPPEARAASSAPRPVPGVEEEGEALETEAGAVVTGAASGTEAGEDSEEVVAAETNAYYFNECIYGLNDLS